MYRVRVEFLLSFELTRALLAKPKNYYRQLTDAESAEAV
jgi:hypothetical protein